jgi:Secretion system C-terminal sorting domain
VRRNLFLIICTVFFLLSSSRVSAQLSYVFSANVIPTYSYNPSPTIVFPSNTDEGISVPINIGFNFNYQGINYSQLKISTNGWVTFNLAAITAMPSNDLSSSGNRPIIAPLWDDLRTSSTGNVNYRLGPNPAIPLKNVLTIEWKLMNWSKLTTQEVISCQLKLYDSTNVIEFVYRSENFNPTKSTASVGLGGTCNNDFYSLNDLGNSPVVLKTVENFNLSNKPTSGQVYRFTPRGPITPVNDLCANATILPYNVGFCSLTFGTLVGATATGSPAAEACWVPATTDRDVWYTVTKPAGQTTMYISTDNVTVNCYPFSTEIAVYSGTCGAFTLVGCASNGGLLNPQSAVLTLSGLPIGATTYYIRVESDGASVGDFQICAKATNDECPSAIVLTPDVTCNYSFFTSVGASNSATTPLPSPSSGYTSGALDVWFKFTASSNFLIIDTKDLVLVDGAMAIYKGLDCATLITLTSAFPNPNPFDDNLSNNGKMPRISRNDFIPGGVYFIRIWANSAPLTGTFGICITERNTCPSNAADTCTFAPTIGLGTWCGDNTQARVTQNLNATYPPDPMDPLVPQYCNVGSTYWNASIDNVMYYKFLTNATGGDVVMNVYNQFCAKDLGLQVALFKPTVACAGGGNWGKARVCYDAIKDPLNDKESDPKNFSMTFTSLLPNTFYYILFDGASADKCTWTMNLAGPITLPIELLSFTGENNGSINLLEWITKTEVNNDYFTLERSFDGENFIALDKIKGAGNSSYSIAYSYVDQAPLNGTNYYRLKQTDFNGESHYSEPIAIDAYGTKSFELISIYPNPAKNQINIKIATQETISAKLSISDVWGRVVLEKEVTVEKGTNIIREDLDEYVPGFYFIYLTDAKMKLPLSGKFIIGGND